MYIAERVLKVMKEDKMVLIQPGQVVPDFDNWNIHSRRSHLSLEWVTQRPDPVPETLEEVLATPFDEPVEAMKAVEVFACKKCSKEFTSSRALKGHMTKAH